jgi:hypothetical protein
MKKIVLGLLFIPFIARTQELKENKVDEFTKDSIKTTTWQALDVKGSMTFNYRVVKKNTDVALEMKLITGKVLSIEKDAKLMFILAGTDSTIWIENDEYKISCNGCGAYNLFGSNAEGIDVFYNVPDNVLSMLLSNRVAKYRIYTSAGYIESDVREPKAAVFQKSFALVQ